MPQTRVERPSYGGITIIIICVSYAGKSDPLLALIFYGDSNDKTASFGELLGAKLCSGRASTTELASPRSPIEKLQANLF